ncbi:HAMP domain-containing sensor histidine kinase [Sediminibacterium goheungense]|uniref:histidine kinase n=1 Tax=Sediminibacterium goheungense TaxID=1086393 RepID=A0A4R6J278_9BACT|nr:ATP-binding protein [Sediminibacterium goheungense]TDO29364.1 PAS/PAC sensor signal transduction histidine kinase [Sediminibacterium goheungense]
MKIKQKLQLGIGLLFAMILLLATMSIYYVHKLSSDTKNILVDNYNTLDYSRKMQMAMDNNILQLQNREIFSENLALQQKNITEPGEAELTASLATHFGLLQQNLSDTQQIASMRKDLSNIMLLNMQAIQRKNKIAGQTSDNSIFWISILGTICFIISFTLLFNLPGNIANPVKELTRSIKEIAERNYARRLHFNKKDEFGDLAASFNTMAEKLEEYQASSVQKLLIEKKRIETLINNMNDPVIGLDENKRVLFMNHMALKIAGLKAEQVAGKSAEELALHNDLIRSLIQELYDEGLQQQPSKLPVKIYADHKESYFEKEIIPIKIIPTGEQIEKLIGTVILLQNITPYKELDFAKTNFIATVSHELKTPISSIRMSLDLLENKQLGELNDEQKNMVASIKEDTTRLLKITGELLNMTQVETGSIQMSVKPASVQEIVDYAIATNRLSAEEKRIQLKTQIPEDIPPVLADKDKTAWVLNNLVSNAIRYSYENATVYISVKEEKDLIRFSVTDTGQGIEPRYMNRVFDRYFRIPGTQKEGTGLGLSISKEFIEAQGGRMELQSEYGKGSEFAFLLEKTGV